MFRRTRRAFHGALLATLTASSLAGATALAASPAGYPQRPVTIVVPYPAGGAADLLGRTLAAGLSARWQQPVIVDNRAGASGQIGTEYVGKAKGDPYTLLLGTQAVFSVLPVLNGKTDFNVETNYTPISLLIKMPSVLMVPSTLGIDNTQQLIDLLKAGKPEQYAFTSNGVGTSQHLIPEDILGQLQVKALHVPYGGSPQALTALASGTDLTFGVDNVPSSLPFIQGGKVKALAITTDTRSPLLPDVPTLAESGLPGFDASTWMGLMAPPAIDPEVQAFISTEVAAVLADPATRQTLEAQGFVPQGNTPEAFRAFVRAESDNLQALIARNGIQAP